MLSLYALWSTDNYPEVMVEPAKRNGWAVIIFFVVFLCVLFVVAFVFAVVIFVFV